VIQHEVPDEAEGERVHLVIMTHAAQTGEFRAACQQLNGLPSVAGPAMYYPVED
jgi:hypothetical protein